MSATTPALDSKAIEKKFGFSYAVRGVSLTIQSGEFVALFGRNGAGKTTFLRLAATLMRPTRGALSVAGFDTKTQPEEARRRIGFLSHNTFVYRDLSPIENLKFFRRLYGLSDAEEPLMNILDRVELRQRARDPVRALSRGMQQRVGIARALLHDPMLLLLDEPYTGLDARAAQTLNAILDGAVKNGRTVVLTTHDLDQGLRGASRAVILDKGAVVHDGAAQDHTVRTAYERYIHGGEGQ